MTRLAGHSKPAVPQVPMRASLGTAIACALLAWSGANAAPAPATAADAEFDTMLLAGGSREAVDLSRFERGNPVMPGVYRVDLYLDGQWSGVADVRFAAPSADANAEPCFTAGLVDQLGLPRDKLAEPARAALEANGCAALSDLIAGATIAYDQAELRLDATVPQAWLGYRPRGYVGPEQWDTGVTAAMLNYNLNAYRTRNAGVSQTSGYLGVNAGLNLGPWRLRHDASLTWQTEVGDQPSRHQWQPINTYARRDIPDWRAQLTLGDSYTSGELFDSVGVRGVQLGTDDRMLPDSLRGYAPSVRGVAETNARVSIRQNGVLLYETTVTPGAFVIDDLYATGYGGDLSVSVTEADGRVREFTVPYAAVPQQLRAGRYRFAVAAGTVHDKGLHDEPVLVQATLQHGITNLLTGYGGVLTSDGYAAALGGVSLNTPFGAVAMDLTAARTKLRAQPMQSGQSLRTTYSKLFPASGTSFSLASYRYSTSGYYSLRDALQARDYLQGHRVLDESALQDPALYLPGVLTPAQRAALQGARDTDVLADSYGVERQRNRFDLTLNQRLGQTGGTLYATVSTRDYWTREGTDLQFQLGYNNRIGWLNYNLSASRLRDVDGRLSNQFFVNFSVPLGTGPRAPSLTAGVVHDSIGQTQAQMTLAGMAGSDNQITYGASVAHQDEVGTSTSANASYRGSYGVANGSYGQGDGYSQASLGLSGTVVAHPGGVTLGQPAGDTFAIVTAPHATGARVLNAPGIRIDRFGHALVPYLTPYNRNTIELDPKGLSLDVQLSATSARVAPHAGSVSRVTFDTTHGRSLLTRLRQSDGQAVPFGAEVIDGQGRGLGMVGQGGRILLRGVGDAGALHATWHDTVTDSSRRCRFTYQVSDAASSSRDAYPHVEAICADAPSDAKES